MNSKASNKYKETLESLTGCSDYDDSELQFLTDLRHTYIVERDAACATIAEHIAAHDDTGTRIAQHRLSLACKALAYVHVQLENIKGMLRVERAEERYAADPITEEEVSDYWCRVAHDQGERIAELEAKILEAEG